MDEMRDTEELRDAESARSSYGDESRSAGAGRQAGGAGRPEELDEDEAVRRRAYDLYIARGEGEGSEVEDWLTAEREVRGGGRGEGADGRDEDGSRR